MTASRLEVVFTDLDADGRALLAVLLERAVSDVAAFQTLASAETFGQARAHAAAAVLIEDWLDGYLEQLRDDGEDESTGADDEPSDAERFFGEDNWWVWRPDARQATVDFLDQQTEELAAELLEQDTLVRLNGPDNPPLVPPGGPRAAEQGLAPSASACDPGSRWPPGTTARTSTVHSTARARVPPLARGREGSDGPGRLGRASW